MDSARNERAFTLLEVLVAMAIIATALVTLLALQSRTLRMMESAERLEGARFLSERLMGEGELQGLPEGGRNGYEGPYRWVLTETRVSRESMPDGVPPLPGRHLALEIWWREGRAEERLSFSQYLYGN